MRIGQGYDTHRFTDGNHVMIGGVKIPFDRGVLAHSDGDVLLHALVDALLGAAALGDIGQHFPDTDPRYANLSSDLFVRDTVALLAKQGYGVGNIDATVILEKPKLKPFVQTIRERLAGLLGVQISFVSVKATTNEGMGFVGRGEGLVAQVVATIIPLRDLGNGVNILDKQ